MVVAVNRNTALPEIGKCSETSELEAENLLQIVENIEARTREALELAGQLEKFFEEAIVDIIKVTKESEKSMDVQPRISCYSN